MEMISQSTPLYAVEPNSGKICTVVGWTVDPGYHRPRALMVELGSQPVYAELVRAGAPVIFAADLWQAEQLAGRPAVGEQRLREVIRDLRDRLVSVAVAGEGVDPEGRAGQGHAAA